MKRKLSVVMIFTLILVSMFIGGKDIKTAFASPDTEIFIDPRNNTYAPCTNFTININVSDVADLYAWEIEMWYNKSVLNVTDFQEGPFLKTAGSTTFYSRANSTGGTIALGAMLDDLTEPGAAGNGTLANITLHVEASGSTCLYLRKHKLFTAEDSTLVPIEHDVKHGCFMYPWNPIINIAVTDVQVPQNIIKQGHTCRIYATIKNQGVRDETFNITVYANDTAIINHTMTNLPCFTTVVIGWDWDTRYVSFGNYTITANATTVPGETDTADNAKTDGWVKVVENAVVSNVVTLFKMYTKPPGVVVNQGYKTWTIQVNASVSNRGTSPLNCTVNAHYHDGTKWTLIGTQNINNLGGNSTTILSFNWNLADVPICNRTIKVNATCPGGGYGESIAYFKVKGIGDVNNDGTRNVLDVILVFINAGPSPPKNVQCDVNGDCTNNVLDVILVFINAGPYGCV